MQATDAHLQANQRLALDQGFLRAALEPVLNAMVRALARGRHAQAVPAAEALREERLAQVLLAGPEASADLRWRLLDDPEALARLHEAVSAGSGHPAWRQALSTNDVAEGEPAPTTPSEARPAV